MPFNDLWSSSLVNHLINVLSINPTASWDMLTPLRGPALYVMCRVMAPEVVVETSLLRHLIHEFSANPTASSDMLSPIRGPALYVICRLAEPSLVVETGVANGISSAFILQALSDNDRGVLYSIELGDPAIYQEFRIPSGKEIGWSVPKQLRSRWSLQFGDSKKLLPDLLTRLEKIDIFLHDNDYSEGHMRWEFRTSWPFI